MAQNNKINRIQAIISRNVSEIIQFNLRNPKIGMVFIPEVKVSSDFSYAKIYVSFIDEKDYRYFIFPHSLKQYFCLWLNTFNSANNQNRAVQRPH